MPIYTLHEGLFDKFKDKKLDPADKKKYESYLNSIYKQHISNWKKIIEDGIKSIPFINMSRIKINTSPDFIFQRGIKAHADVLTATDYYVRNTIDDNMKNTINALIMLLMSKLRDYNKDNGIGWMEMIYENNLTGFRIYAAALLKDIECEALAKNESTIFSDIEII